MTSPLSIMWFRQDLRLSDNLAVLDAAQHPHVLPIYIFDDRSTALFKQGGASKMWLHHSLDALNNTLGGNLNIYQGKAEDVLADLIKHNSIQHVSWNICVEPWLIDQENAVKALCDKNQIRAKAFNSNYLWSPNDVLKDDGTFYKVFTPYKRRSYTVPPREPVAAAKMTHSIKDPLNKTTLADLDLIPAHAKWPHNIKKVWKIGEDAAQEKLDLFIQEKLSGYKVERDFPAKEQASQLSPHLHFGEISPVQIWQRIKRVGPMTAPYQDIDHFLSEVIWREFSTYLLYHAKNLHHDNFNSKFDALPWENNPDFLKAWQQGNTGFPIVDAGMRQLWETGYMHNRVRMVTASFLVKNLNIHWHKGRDWFWDCLVDADLASNNASWQWVAGCGADAAPYYRIFNPVLQGEKFDQDGLYTRKYVPALKNLPTKYLHKPWTAPEHILVAAGVILGETYPHPIVDLAASRNKALAAYKTL